MKGLTDKEINFILDNWKYYKGEQAFRIMYKGYNYDIKGRVVCRKGEEDCIPAVYSGVNERMIAFVRDIFTRSNPENIPLLVVEDNITADSSI